MDCESDKASSEAGSERGTPRSQDQETLRCDTPGTMPTYQYSKEQLYTLEKMPASLIVPDCLEKEYIVDGVWDPERWVRFFGGTSGDCKVGSRGPSPLTAAGGDPRDKRAEMFRRNSGCEHSLDPRERLKEEKDAVVLSPQRRSFGTGCHVSHQPLLQRALSNIKADRGRRDGQRRIGSGRIQIDHDREPDFRKEGLERDRDFRSERSENRGSERKQDVWNEHYADKESRGLRNAHESVNDRDYHKPRDNRNRFERQDRDKRFEQTKVFNSSQLNDDRHRDSQEFQSFNNRHNHHHDRYNCREVEPEWFSAGPSSKGDTIELHGFDQEQDPYTNEALQDGHHVDDVDTHILQNTDGDTESYDDDDEDNVQTEAINVEDRNGSLETNESSLSETNQPDMDVHTTRTPPTSGPSFDFNEFFNIDNIPGLTPVQDESLIETDLTNIGGSRFYQLYKIDQGGCGSKGNSRCSSLIEDEFSYLNDMLNGSRSPLNHSPVPASANFIKDCSSFLTPFASSDKQHHLEFGTVSQKFGTITNHNALVTALLNNAAVFERNRSSPTSLKNSPQDVDTKLKTILFGKLDSPLNSGNTSPGFSSPLNVPGKVKTVAELESELQRNMSKPMLRSSTPPNGRLQDRASPHEDLTAFNKLISLMQAGAATPVESPKIPLNTNSTIFSAMPRTDLDLVDGYLVNLSTSTSLASPQYSNLNDSSAAQKQFLEALQRNKVQQLQIRQATMQRHQGHISNNMAQLNNQLTSQLQQMLTRSQQNNQQTSQLLQMLTMPPQNNQQTTQLQYNMQQQTAAPLQQMVTLQQQNNQQTSRFQQILDKLINQGTQGQRSSTDNVVTSFHKANLAIITKPASPPTTPLQPMLPIMTYVTPVASPRGPSGPSPFPVLQSSTLLSHQAPVSPRVPSPIMFSQQPPMHLNAPSPIHPINGLQTPVGQPGSSTNTIRPPFVPRVPSPQELVMHTQAILQNALIKKQLEDQKERFFKKQQERVKSPNTIMGSICINISSSGYVTSQSPAPATSMAVCNKTAGNVACTPTLVVRKMHTKKASEKERSGQDIINDATHDEEDHILNDLAEKHPGTDIKRFDSDQSSNQSMHMLSPSVQHYLPSQHHHQTAAIIPPTSLPPPSMIHTMPPPPLLNQMDVSTSQQIRAFICQQNCSSFGSHLLLSTPMSSISSSLPVSGRPIVKGNPYVLPQMMATPTTVYKKILPQRPIIGGNSAVPTMDMVKLLQQQHMKNAPHIPMSQLVPQSTPYGISLTGVGKLPVQSTTLRFGPQAPTPVSSQQLIQQMMQGSNQRTFGPLASLHTQQRIIDPRSAYVPYQQGMAPKTVPQQLNPQRLNPHLQMNTMINGPNSQGHIPVAMVTVSSSNKGDNLMKWFSTDILKTSLPTMPPLPVQGQHVLTLDEIERS